MIFYLVRSRCDNFKGADRGHSDFFDVSHINLVFHLKLCNEMIFRSSSSSIRCSNILANDKYNQNENYLRNMAVGKGGVLNNNSNEVPCINLIDYMQHIDISIILEKRIEKIRERITQRITT